MDYNGISSLQVFGKLGGILAFLIIVGKGLWLIWGEVKEHNRLRQEKEENRKKEHLESMQLLEKNLERISDRLDRNDDKTDFAENLGLYAHERLDQHLGENHLPILKKARRGKREADNNTLPDN